MTGILDDTVLLDLYRSGRFPMATDRNAHWIEIIDPQERGVFPLNALHIPKRLKRTVRQQPFRISVNSAFAQTMDACAMPAPGRESTWISDDLINLYCTLHRQGFAHSIECWDGKMLIGGLYGVSLEGAFFGESMFSLRRDASKIALTHLMAGLVKMGFELLDAQFHNPHLEQFGLIKIDRKEFQRRLKTALIAGVQFDPGSVPVSGTAALSILQDITQTS